MHVSVMLATVKSESTFKLSCSKSPSPSPPASEPHACISMQQPQKKQRVRVLTLFHERIMHTHAQRSAYRGNRSGILGALLLWGWPKRNQGDNVCCSPLVSARHVWNGQNVNRKTDLQVARGHEVSRNVDVIVADAK